MDDVRKIWSSVMIVVVVLYITPLQQFLKVPVLLEHYGEHKERKPGITFCDFICMHYIGDDGVADDDSKDMQLPFKKVVSVTLFEAYEPSVAMFHVQAEHKYIDITYSSFKNNFCSDPFPGSLLKPPQVSFQFSFV